MDRVYRAAHNAIVPGTADSLSSWAAHMSWFVFAHTKGVQISEEQLHVERLPTGSTPSGVMCPNIMVRSQTRAQAQTRARAQTQVREI